MDKDKEEKSAELLRNLLGSIDLSDISELEKAELSNEEFLERAAIANEFYKNHFEKVLKLLIQKQFEWIGTQTQGSEQLMFGRGTINGLFLVQGWFEDQFKGLAQHQEDNKPQKPIYGHV